MAYKKLILGRPKLVSNIVCSKCKSSDIVALPTIDVECKNCKTKFTTNLEINIYYASAKKLLQLISNNDGLVIIGERDPSDVFRAEDLLKPRSKWEDDLYTTMLAIRNNFITQKCWEVSEITNEYDTDYRVSCKSCGFCRNCVVCQKCKSHYTPKVTKGGEKRYTCPQCKSKSYKQSEIVFKKEKNKNVCPHCGSENISRRRINSPKKTCPHCGSTNLTTPRKIPIYKLVIERQRRNLL